tara:strand:+ start:1629 stop:2036 length:408 start_codon:yes stop_codon:yes gene_type:complete
MKRISDTFKNIGKWTLDKLIKYEKRIYAFIIIFVLFGLCLSAQEIKHSSESLKLSKENAALFIERNDLEKTAKEQALFIRIQAEAVGKQHQQTIEAERIIRMQHLTIENLIKYLKSIDEWPPEKPDIEIDPNRII